MNSHRTYLHLLGTLVYFNLLSLGKHAGLESGTVQLSQLRASITCFASLVAKHEKSLDACATCVLAEALCDGLKALRWMQRVVAIQLY